MFSIFRKKQDSELKKRFDEKYAFSIDQKHAILLSLFEIANSDEEFHEKETAYFKNISEFIGMRLSNRDLKRMLSQEQESLYKLLDEMTDSQKDWYVITALGMVYADGELIEDEFNHVKSFLLELGFTEARIRQNMS